MTNDERADAARVAAKLGEAIENAPNGHVDILMRIGQDAARNLIDFIAEALQASGHLTREPGVPLSGSAAMAMRTLGGNHHKKNPVS